MKTFKRVYQRMTPEQRERHEAVRKQIEAERPQLEQEARDDIRRFEINVVRFLRGRGLFDSTETVATLKAAREARNLSLADISERTGIDEQTLDDLESGEDGDPSLRTLKRYAEALGLRFHLGLIETDDRTTGETRTKVGTSAGGES